MRGVSGICHLLPLKNSFRRQMNETYFDFDQEFSH